MERVGLRRLIFLNLCCAALGVSYSIAACKSPWCELSFFIVMTGLLSFAHTIVWLHQVWTTQAALLSFLFSLVGGGDLVRITLVCKCIADVCPPEKL